ncbi:hypothetical protein QQ008_00130 [Fulvivirgaceae bacterium BMA10]|uniref:Lipoprotein n=1 Tax=Splendidivirga corallicola TaxID=3051826 RepID=A0ABT8KG92_9BACT|nr:hypothetical protein [Fulvivirgaceae bacterium BMA10]
MKNSRPLLFLLSIILFACNGSRTLQQATLVEPLNETDDIITKSLFQSKDRTISEEDIKRLLDGKIRPADSSRIAIYKFGSSGSRNYSNYWYNEDYLKMQQNYVNLLNSEIEKSARVKEVKLMPSIMTHTNPNLTNLRESAVRLQADLLLIISISSNIYHKFKLFKKDQAKAFATVETVLLDVRTGVVPFSNIVTKEKLTMKHPSDLDISETRKRAENEATMDALRKSGKDLVAFLK